MDFSFTEDQTAISDLAGQIFKDRATDEFLLQYDREDNIFDQTLWNTLAEQGLLALAIPESCGGSGLGFMELALILQEQGRRVAPVPLLSNLVMAALPIAQFGSEALQQKYLAPLATGEHQISAALSDLALPEAMQTPVKAVKSGENWILNGSKQAVPFGTLAAAILVPAIDADGNSLVFMVDSSLEGVELEGQTTSLGREQLATLQLNNVSVSSDAQLGENGQGDEILDWTEQRTNTAICAIQLGVTEEALKRTAEFTSERKQFGAPLGTFQAVAMRAADAYIDVEALRSTFWQAAWSLSEGRKANAEVRAAKYWACIGGHRVVHTAQHLHGGMGSDVEFPIHRYFLWEKHMEHILGSTAKQLKELGEELAADDSLGAHSMAL